MSTRLRADLLEPETLAEIVASLLSAQPCSCASQGVYWDLCDFHEGFEEGVERLRKLIRTGAVAK